MTYHSSIAINYFARRLGAQYQMIAVLQALWGRSDPHEHEPVVCIDFADLEAIVPSPGRLRQITAKLANLGALERLHTVEREYRLFKPPVDVLDEPALAELERARRRHAHAQELLQRAQVLIGKPGEHEAPSLADGRDALSSLNKRPSDIRDVLADMADKPAKHLRFSGHGSGAVQAAALWLAETSATWEQFVALCERVKSDPYKPADAEWLFGAKHAEYRDRVLATLHAQPSTVTMTDATMTMPEQAPSPDEPKRVRDVDPDEFAHWLSRRIGAEEASELLSERADVLRDMPVAEVNAQIVAWQRAPERALMEFFG